MLIVTLCLVAQEFLGRETTATIGYGAISGSQMSATKSRGEDAAIFNAAAYGAVGDGVTDDTAAFAAVLADAAQVHGTVRVPAGTYLTTVTVNKSGVSVIGAGKDVTIIKAPATVAASIAGRVLTVAVANHTRIKDLTIDGNKSAHHSYRPLVYSLLLYKSDDCSIENVRVINSGQIGIGLSASRRARISGCEVEGSDWQNITTLNNPAGGCDGSVITHCRSKNSGYDNIQVTAVGAVTIEHCDLSGSPFAGIYVATGARNVTLRENRIERCYTGIDLSFGMPGGANAGPDSSEGNAIIGNHVTHCENVGIGCASNGTLITGNSVSDIGAGASVTYTLLGQKTIIVRGGSGYRVGDILTLIGGTAIKPAQVQVASVDRTGAITSITLANHFTNYYLGAYSAPPDNPISVTGGSGIGAAVSTTWNQRDLQCAGIEVLDASYVAITNNQSGNTNSNRSQRYGVALLYRSTHPSHLTIANNNLSANSVSPISSLMPIGGRRTR